MNGDAWSLQSHKRNRLTLHSQSANCIVLRTMAVAKSITRGGKTHTKSHELTPYRGKRNNGMWYQQWLASVLPATIVSNPDARSLGSSTRAALDSSILMELS